MRRILYPMTIAALLLAGAAQATPVAAPAAPVRAAVPAAPPATAPIVVAQRRNMNLFDFLFGGTRTRRPSRDVGPPRGARPERDVPAAPATPKDPDARRVYVLGDAFAAGLANSLEAAFANTPTVEIIAKVKPDSGLVRDDHYDWQAVVSGLLASEERIDVAIIMLGSNDRQSMRLDDGSREKTRSEKWDAAYIARVDALLDLFAARGVPVYWVGLPIMRPEGYSQDMAFLNEVFQARVQRAGGRFIDVWSRFADEEGRFSATGPDVSGRTRRLRNANGINLTRTGNEKLAFFVEQQLRSGLAADGAFANIPTLAGTPPHRRPSGPVEMEVSLTRHDALPTADRLAGGDEAPALVQPPVDETAPDYKLFVRGESPPPRKGRADDFSWPRETDGGKAVGSGG